MDLKVLRNGHTQSVSVTLAEYPSKEERASLDTHNNGAAPDKSLDGVQRREHYP